MKIFRASLAPLVLSTAYALITPGVQADETDKVDKNKPNKPVPVQNVAPQPPPLPQAGKDKEPIRDRHASTLQRIIFEVTQKFGGEANVDPRIRELQKEHEAKLIALQKLASEDPSKLAKAISDMHIFYTDTFGETYSQWGHNRLTRNYLLAISEERYTKLFLRCLELVSSSKEDEHRAGLDSIKAFHDALPWNTLPRGELPIEEVVDAKKHLEPYFQKRFSGVNEPNERISLLEEGMVLLRFAGMQDDHNACQNTFLSWFGTNLKNSVTGENPSVEEGAAFNSAMNEIMQYLPNYLPDLFYPERYDVHAKSFSVILGNYPVLVKALKNKPESLSVSLDMVDKLESLCTSQNKQQYPESYALYSKGIIELFDYATSTIPELPESAAKEKLENRMLLLPALHASYTRTTRERKNEYLQVLGKNYFSRSDYIGDTAKFISYVNQVSRQVQWRNNTSNYPSYVFLYLIDNHPEFFQKGTERLCDDLKTSNDLKRAYTIQALGETHRLFSKFIDIKSINAKDVEFYNLASRVSKWSKENVGTPIAQQFLDLVKSERVNAQIVRANLAVDDKCWHELNNRIDDMSRDNPEFCTKLNLAVKSRLQSEANPYSRAKALEALRLSWQHGGEIQSTLLPLIANEKSYQGVVEIGHLLADAIYFENENIIYDVKVEPGEEDTSKPEDWGAIPAPKITTVLVYVTSNEFSQRLIDYTDRKIKFNALSTPINNRELTPAQSTAVKCISILHGDMKLIKELTGREFNPPTFIKTYFVNGKSVVIKVTSGDKESYEKERELWKQDARFVKEEVDRSRQDPGDGPALRQAMHNAFLTLAYSAAKSYTYDSERYPKPPAPPDDGYVPYDQKYKEAIIKYLEQNLYHSVFYDPDPVHWGEKAAALVELYNSCEDNPLKRNKFVESKINDLRGFFFEKDRDNLGIIKDAMPVFENLEESMLQGLAWEKHVLLKDFKYNGSIKDKYRDDLNKIQRELIDFRTDFAYGFLRSSEHLGLDVYAEHLKGKGSIRDVNRVEGLGLYLSEVHDAARKFDTFLTNLK